MNLLLVARFILLLGVPTVRCNLFRVLNSKGKFLPSKSQPLPSPKPSTKPQISPLPVAGFGNYGHKILHSNGIPDENTIDTMVDDIAHNPDNPTPGIIIPDSKDVYNGVQKDYTGEVPLLPSRVQPLPLGLPPQPSTKPQKWALLVAGSAGYYNYRHQADVCHAYQILHSNGIPDENIIVMMVDDIANNSDNPTPGIIINHPDGKDVYHGVPKDYTGEQVNSKTFLHVLTGNKTGVQGIGSGRVIESGPNDHVFVNFVDHGGPGILCFPDDVLAADDLIKALKDMALKSQFSKMILYIEACYSGSMFDNLLADDLNIFVTTAADPFESSYACYFDEKRETYLGDVFSVNWMEDMPLETPAVNDLHHQFERVRTRTNTSHVEEYGDLDIGNTKLKDVLGFSKKNMSSNGSAYEVENVPTMDVHDNLHVPIQILKNQLEKYKDGSKRKELKKKLRSLEKKRSEVDRVVDKIIDNLLDLDEDSKEDIRVGRHSLNEQNFPCYKKLLTLFSDKCFNIPKNPYVRIHLQKFINMCGVPSLTVEKAVEAIESICFDEERYVNFFAQ